MVKTIIINDKPVQVRSQLYSKINKSLIIRKGFKAEDYYFMWLMIVQPLFLWLYSSQRLSKMWQMDKLQKEDRPYVWSIPTDKLKPISEFINE